MASKRVNLYNNTALTTAITGALGTVASGLASAKFLLLYANLVVGGGGTTADVYVQTSFDNGATWVDVANFHFTTSSAKKMSAVVIDPATPLTAGSTPTDGSIANNTVLNGIIGDMVRAKVTTTGTYTGTTTLRVDMVAKD
jgi:hypothetical protein